METSYFQWLCALIHADSFEKSYYILCGELFKYPFWVKVQRDINRSNDGLELRKEYWEDITIEETPQGKQVKTESDCSMFELFIGIAKRMNDELMTEDSGDKTHEYFWEMMKNLELDKFDDEKFGEETGACTVQVRDILGNFNERRYKRDGSGGIFPLRHPEKSQKNVEIWYQMQAYINENYKIQEEM